MIESMLYELTYINERGESVSFKGSQYNFREPGGQKDHFSNPFSLIKFEGFGEVGADVQLQKAPFQDGSTHIGTQLEERHPYLEFAIVAKDWNGLSLYRQTVSRVFNPKINGRFELSYDNKTFILYSIPESVPHFADEDTVGRSQVVSINFVSPNPYWQSEQIISEPMTAYRGLFRFPLTLPTQFGEEGTTQVFVNEGDVDTPVQIEFRGPATNPRVTNKTTGEFIQINQELEEGETLFVDTTPGNKRIEIICQDGTVKNVFNWIHPFSTFWKLVTGPNEIEYTADAGRVNAVVSIKWRNQYLAV